LTVIEKTLKPSSETEMTTSDLAYSILGKYDTKISSKSEPQEKIALFDTLAKKDGYFVRPAIKISDENPMIYGFETTFAEDKLFKLAYDKNSEVGTMVSAPIKDKGRYVIAIVSSIREKGVPKFEDVMESMRAELIKEKKAKRFTNQLINAKTLEAAAKTGNTEVRTGEVTFGNPNIPNGGYEPSVVGSLFFKKMKDGTKTLPLKGEQGVYVIRINKTINPPAVANYDAEKMQLLSGARGRMQNEAKQALIKKAEVQDNRKFNQLGIMRD
jgi:peptidyl-prolyl cis-trans isomerase D